MEKLHFFKISAKVCRMYLSRLCIALIVYLFVTGCEEKAQRNFYGKGVEKGALSCMRLEVSPYDLEIGTAIKKEYPFTPHCPNLLSVEHKSCIVCNSSYNVTQKSLGHLPNSYLKLMLYRRGTLRYSYYIDLDHKPDSSDITAAMRVLRSDLGIAQ